VILVVTPCSSLFWYLSDKRATESSGHFRQGRTYVAELILVATPERALQTLAAAMRATECTAITIHPESWSVTSRSRWLPRRLNTVLYPTHNRFWQQLEATVDSTNPVHVVLKARSIAWPDLTSSSNWVLNDLEEELDRQGQLSHGAETLARTASVDSPWPPTNPPRFPPPSEPTAATPGPEAVRFLHSLRLPGWTVAAMIAVPLMAVTTLVGGVAISAHRSGLDLAGSSASPATSFATNTAELDLIQAANRTCSAVDVDRVATTEALHMLGTRSPTPPLVQEAMTVVQGGVAVDEADVMQLETEVRSAGSPTVEGLGPSLQRDLQGLKAAAVALAAEDPSDGAPPPAIQQYNETLQRIIQQLGPLVSLGAKACGR
jgi:hypothetical protein